MPDDKLEKYFADLHVHTALSPCADDSCTPPNIVSAALGRGLQMIAVTDHNSAENAAAVMKCGERRGLTALPGIEMTTREEVHLVCIFDTAEAAFELQSRIYAALPDEPNRPDYFGRQLVMDENGETLGECGRMLMGAAGMALEEAVAFVRGLGGLAVAAHIDRPAFSALSNLGWIPPDAGLDALEVSPLVRREEAFRRFPEIGAFPLISSSDAHLPENIGDAATLFLLAGARVGEIRMALGNIGGRECIIR